MSAMVIDPLNVTAGVLKSQQSWQAWELSGLMPDPYEAWCRMREFLALGPDDLQAMLQTVEPLLQRAHELVVSNYDHLLNDPGSAAVLGWEDGPDEAHLAERRRFFTVWIARTLGMDMSEDFAYYLFKAGKYHAGHGPRAIHVPELYVTAAISLVHAAFARFLAEAMPGAPVVPRALAAWHKLLSLHLHMMHMGYQAACDLGGGDFTVRVAFYGLVRQAAECPHLEVGARHGERVEHVLRRVFNYLPRLRERVFEARWDDVEPARDEGAPWLELERRYVVRTHPAWRVLHNGRNLCHVGGPVSPVAPGDEIRLYSPGR